MIEFIAIIVVGFCVVSLCISIYHLFDHTQQPSNTKLDPKATIIDFRSEKVEYSKNGAKFKTTVVFSDGFRYITHRTNRKDGIFTYQIGIDNSLRKEIIEKAISKHDEAINKQKYN